MAWAVEITENVNAVGGPEVRSWSRVLGPDVGTLSWSTVVAHIAELAQQVKAITGRPTSFGTSVTGPFGAVAFFALSETREQVRAANEALAADADWLASLDERASKADVAESSEQMIIRRRA